MYNGDAESEHFNQLLISLHILTDYFENGLYSSQQEKIELTKNDLRILQVLMENKDKVVSRDTLMMKLWESDSYVDENTLSVNVNRLRKKLEALGLEDFILTKKGIGYRIG